MKTTALLAAVVLFALGLLAGCTTQPKADPVASRPSLTIFPVQMAGQSREDVAALVAMMLEERGLDSIEVEQTVFSAEADAPFAAQVDAFAAFVKERELSTEYALFASVIGSPQHGVDEVHCMLVGADGDIAWTERQTRESRALTRAKPSDPMSATMFLVERLNGPLDLLKPERVNASGGKWAEYWKADSLAPADVEFDRMEARLATLSQAGPTATVLVYPVRAGDTWSAECANRLADEINRHGLLDATVAESPLSFTATASRNQQRVLWSGARSIQQLVQDHPPATDYVLFADYMVSAETGEARGVHTFLLDAEGQWIIVDFQNSHHDDFNAIQPRSLSGCCDLSIKRLSDQLNT